MKVSNSGLMDAGSADLLQFLEVVDIDAKQDRRLAFLKVVRLVVCSTASCVLVIKGKILA